ncbi:hypothetical protein AAKU55_005435 [Oxalobacteraceae bacterium GrIS 1.11]
MHPKHAMEQAEFVRQAIAIQTEFLDHKGAHSDHAAARARSALDRFRLIGHTAAYFGRHQGMLDLRDAIAAAGGDRYWTTEMWHGIDGWST